MTTIMTLQETKENRFNRILKDERGLTMVELLATVVILAIIMGIGALAIGGVIQRSREDGAVSEVKSAYDAGKMFQVQDLLATGASSFTLTDVVTEGLFDTTLDSSKATAIVFKVDAKGKLTMYVPAATFKAGNKDSLDVGSLTAGADSKYIKELTRDGATGNLFAQN
ncbi:type II secretion system protein [uncultured Vagococcus sp.]|uniref:pilus assembly FimT family protein n=1 Tax=uncultured Vagococcus sp. TaxID=189676 RepID=UPI0028D2842E|nr:type II secretion system protein [uncultured Vagococcus sp.]